MSECQSIDKLGIQVDHLGNTFNGHEEHESWPQGQQEQIWEVETFCEKDNGEVCNAQSEPSSFEVVLISDDHEILVEELVTLPKEPTQYENKIELINLSHVCPKNSSIEEELIDFIGVDNSNWVVDPYLVYLVNNLKITLIKNRLVVEQQYSRRLKNIEFSNYQIIWYVRM